MAIKCNICGGNAKYNIKTQRLECVHCGDAKVLGQFGIVDSLSKRITFLNHLTKELGLTNVKAVAARAEEYAIDHRESFDIVSARAVARLNILNEICDNVDLNQEVLGVRLSAFELFKRECAEMVEW